MSDITEENVMKYCWSRNLMLVTRESLEYMHRPIVIETMNKDVIPIEWIKKYIDSTLDEGNSQMLGFKAAIIKEMVEEWKKENEIN